jgi:methylated-DNA-protein-cysteine methyltransferase related protein
MIQIKPFRLNVIKAVKMIPEGKVATYGQIARMIGHPKAARQVGMVLFGLRDSEAEDIPWQRIINSQGGISTYKVGHGELQRALLEAERVVFDIEGKVDLAVFQWESSEEKVKSEK